MRVRGKVVLPLVIVAVLSSLFLYISFPDWRRVQSPKKIIGQINMSHKEEQAVSIPSDLKRLPPLKEQVEVPTSIEELLEATDKLTVDYLLKKHLFPPSTLPYNLSSSSDPDKLKASPLKGYITTFGAALDPKVKGFFVEAGAYNGEISSNTLQLETKGWEGLLVEGSLTHFQNLKLKHRKAWIADVCLATKVKKMIFAKYKNTVQWGYGDMSYKPFDKEIPEEYMAEAETECFPLRLLLKALNRTRIDFFSLDVEGFEYEVLKDFPFEEIDVRTMVVENTHSPGGHKALADLMIPKGFDVILANNQDSYFVKKAKADDVSQ